MSSSSSSASVRLILGTMTIGPAIGNTHCDGSRNQLAASCQTPPDVAWQQLQLLLSSSHARANGTQADAGLFILDTASAYQNGYTEEVLGRLLSQLTPDQRNSIAVHTKANNLQLPHRSLSKQSVLDQANTSLKALQIPRLHLYYLHGPDINTDIDSTLDAIQELSEQGKIGEFGLSNYPAWKVTDIYYRCKQRKMVLPTVYQGSYNALTRAVEFELAGCCRELGIRMYHYNPLAGGLLTGKYTSVNDQQLKEMGRFGSASPIGGAIYSARYWKQQYFEGLEIVRRACDAAGITMAAAALRWLLHHSVLSSLHGDGIIMGASTLAHLEANLKACGEGPLPSTVVEAFDRAWEVCRFASPPYFRNYGDAPGNSNTFLKKFQPFVPNSAV